MRQKFDLGEPKDGKKTRQKEEASIILEILNRIPLSKRFVSVDDILNSLASAEIDVSRRSLQRYLKQMYDCGKYGLVRDDRGNAYGYRRERTDSITDSIHLKPNECLLLRIAQEHMKYQIPGTVLKSLGFLFDAASEMLKEKGSNAKENQWLNKVCVISSSIPQMPSKVLPRIFDAVSEALYSEKKLRIEYTNMNGKTTSAVVSPLALVQQDVRLYLICQFDHFDNVVHLALHRFKKQKSPLLMLIDPKTLIFSLTSTTATLITATENGCTGFLNSRAMSPQRIWKKRPSTLLKN